MLLWSDIIIDPNLKKVEAKILMLLQKKINFTTCLTQQGF